MLTWHQWSTSHRSTQYTTKAAKLKWLSASLSCHSIPSRITLPCLMRIHDSATLQERGANLWCRTIASRYIGILVCRAMFASLRVKQENRSCIGELLPYAVFDLSIHFLHLLIRMFCFGWGYGKQWLLPYCYHLSMEMCMITSIQSSQVGPICI